MSNKVTVKKNKILIIIGYTLLFLINLIQSFSQLYTDENTYIKVGYFMSKGLIPYVDFFEHHALFYFVFYLPIFTIFSPVISQIIIRIISSILIFLSTFIVYKIVEKNNLGNPHYASLFFLLGYSGLPINFLRNEFFASFVLLLYFYFDNKIVKGILLAVFGSASIMFLPVAIILAIYIFYRLSVKRLKKSLDLFVGLLIGSIPFLLFMIKVPARTLYYNLITVNQLLGKLRTYQWYQVIFFSQILSTPYIIFGIYGLVKKRRKLLAQESIILLIGIYSIIVVSSIMSGGLQKLKLPSYLPALFIFSLF